MTEASQKSRLRKIFLVAAIAFQFAVLAYMAAQREYIVLAGRTVYLRTAPVDPNDPFRGQYVRLNYDISTIPMSSVKDSDARRSLAGDEDSRYSGGIRKGVQIYTVLKEGENGLMGLDYCTLAKPSGGIFIKGRTDYNWRFSRGELLYLKYGIESYFVQEGRGVDIERRAGSRDSVQIPMEMEVALDSSGTAVLKGFRWSPLGIGIRMIETPAARNFAGGNADSQQPEDANARRTVKIMLTLQNSSDNKLAIVNLPDFRSFSLEPVKWAEEEFLPAVKFESGPIPSDKDVLVLDPGGKFEIEIDLADARWFVETKKDKREIGMIDNPWGNMFRMVYRPPSADECRTLENSSLIWHGYLESRAFSGTGGID